MKDGKPWRQRMEEKRAAREARNVPPPPKQKKARVTRSTQNPRNPHLARGIVPWAEQDMPRLFEGKIVAIVGGGPSLKPLIAAGTLKALHEQFPEVEWIAVNNSYKIAPWASIK